MRFLGFWWSSALLSLLSAWWSAKTGATLYNSLPVCLDGFRMFLLLGTRAPLLFSLALIWWLSSLACLQKYLSTHHPWGRHENVQAARNVNIANLHKRHCQDTVKTLTCLRTNRLVKLSGLGAKLFAETSAACPALRPKRVKTGSQHSTRGIAM